MMMRTTILLGLMGGLMAWSHPAKAGTMAQAASWQYTLLPGSLLVDDCYCGRPTISMPMAGNFQLRWLDENPLFTRYLLTNISFSAGGPPGTTYTVTGSGIYEVGGEVGVVQKMSLALWIDNGVTNKLCYLTNDIASLERPWPMLKAHLDQTNGAIIQFFRVDLVTAPFREIWFSTANSFHAGIWSPATNAVSHGDLLSSAGRVVKRNQDLTAHLGFMPMVPDLGLDALDILPGGEIAFSMNESLFSEQLEFIHEGDVVSEHGRILRRNQDLLLPLKPDAPAGDAGLDALQVMSNGEICFSIRSNVYSQTLKRMIRRGDLLSSNGTIVKTNEQLLARFQPSSAKGDLGLDALYIWPSGEIWFSTEDGFTDQQYGAVTAGDILSDHGYVVCRNLDLLNAFAPLEDQSSFGLDALFVVTDTTPPPSTPSRLIQFMADRKTRKIEFGWKGEGRLYQLEYASDAVGPWLPLTPLGVETNRTIYWLSNSVRSFYRLRQW